MGSQPVRARITSPRTVRRHRADRGGSSIEHPLETRSDPFAALPLQTVGVGIQTTFLVLATLLALPFVADEGEIQMGLYMTVLLTMLVAALIVSMLPWPKFLSRRAGRMLLYSWSILDVVAISLFVHATGGGASQLFWLYAVSTVFFSIAYPPRGHIPLILLTFVSYFSVLYFDDWGVGWSSVIFRVATLVCIAWLGHFLSKQLILLLKEAGAATQELQALDHMKNSFLVALAHDLRTPLTVILGFAETLHRQEARLSSEMRKDFAEKIVENARRLGNILDDLIDIKRLTEGELEPKHRRYIDLGWLLKRVVSESALLETHRVDCDFKRVVLLVDEVKVERMVENLLGNAAKHTPPGTQVWVKVDPVPGGGVITVEDAGPGLSAEVRAEIFNLFRQGPDIPNESPGIGIGLYLVARFASVHGGWAWVDERPGGGASFKVFLPGRGPSPR